MTTCTHSPCRLRAGVLEDVTEARRKQPGRPRKLDPNQFAMARAALAVAQPVEQVAAAFGVSRASTATSPNTATNN